jgi:hypothetical protein
MAINKKNPLVLYGKLIATLKTATAETVDPRLIDKALAEMPGSQLAGTVQTPQEAIPTTGTGESV